MKLKPLYVKQGASAMTMGRTIVSYPAALAVYFVFIGLFYYWTVLAQTKLEIVDKIKWKKGDVSSTANISCEVSPETANVTWLFKAESMISTFIINEKQRDQDGNPKKTKTSIVTISNATTANAGNYTCVASLGDQLVKEDFYLDLHFPARFINGSEPLVMAVSESATVNAWCVFEAFNVTKVKWYKEDNEHEVGRILRPAVPVLGHPKLINSTISIRTLRVDDNGTYICEIQDPHEQNGTHQGKIEVIIKAPPKLIIDVAKGISTTQVYLKWTVFAFNSKIKSYNLFYSNVSGNFILLNLIPRIMPDDTSYVVKGLQKFTNYSFRLEVETEFNRSHDSVNVQTLDFDPDFVPKVSINDFSATSVTIGWKKVDEKVAEYIHYYILEARKKDENNSRQAFHHSDEQNLPYMFGNLHPHSTYIFKVRACSEYTGLCGNWSDEMEAATSDGIPTKPTNVQATCATTYMNLTWGPPDHPNAEIKGYNMELTGNATSRDRTGKEKQVTWGPLSKFTTNETRSVRFDDLLPNTHYTVRLTAMTRTRRRGSVAIVSCDTSPAPPDLKLEIVDKIKFKEGAVGSTAKISCEVSPETSNVTWLFREESMISTFKINEKQRDQDGNPKKTKTSIVTISNATTANAGNYTCVASLGDQLVKEDFYLDLHFPARFINGSEPLVMAVSESATVNAWCVFEAFNVTKVKWYKEDNEHEVGSILRPAVPVLGHPKLINSTISIRTLRVDDNGTYICEIQDPHEQNGTHQGKIEVIIKAPPKLIIDVAKGISTTQVYLKWTVFAFNSKIKSYNLFYSNVSGNFILLNLIPRIMPDDTSYVVKGLQKFTNYSFRLEVETEFNRSHDSVNVQTLDFDPDFVPKLSINDFSATSVTIGWKKVDEKVAEYIHYYILEARKKDENNSRQAFHHSDEQNLPYMFGNLHPHSTYIFKVRACSEYTGLCGNWSDEMEAATSDGIPTKPTNVQATCATTYMNLTWGPPDHPNAEIKGYNMELTGNATSRDRTGKEKQVTWGPLSKFTTNETRSVRFDDLLPNTHYTVRLTAMTRTRRRGSVAIDSCETSPAPPDHPPRPRWRKILQDDKHMFKMYLPRISERNGRLCCYRVYMVRLTDWKNLSSPRQIKVLEHKHVHAQPPELGAYITDIFSNDNFPIHSELVMGDERSQFNKSDPIFNNPVCNRCLKRPRRIEPTTTTTMATTTEEEFFTEDPFEELPVPQEEDGRSRRNFTNDPTLKDRVSSAGQLIGDRDTVVVHDGPLDTTANYTLFVELITEIEGEPPIYSEYVNVLMPAPTPPVIQPTSADEIALQLAPCVRRRNPASSNGCDAVGQPAPLPTPELRLLLPICPLIV